jgi:AraC-like DNA-binding protein
VPAGPHIGAAPNPAAPFGSARIGGYRNLPEVLRKLGVDLRDVLESAGVRADIFDSAENRLAYPDLGRLLRECERLSGCDHIMVLTARRTALADLGLAGQIALCADTAGGALQTLADHFTLQNSAAIVSLVTFGAYTRFVFAIVEQGMAGSWQLQLGAMATALNIMQELCGPGFLPTVVTFANRSPRNLKPLHQLFHAPLRFDSDESALVFERRWLDRPLPPIDPRMRRTIEAEARARRQGLMADLPATVRYLVRKQLLVGDCSMDHVAARLGMHRRTLDRHLRRHGVLYRELVESLQSEVARQLLLDTEMQVQRVAESLRFSSAANFATAFRRWTGATPSQFRRAQQHRLATPPKAAW